MNIRRYNFSSRCVIRQDPQLRIDQIKLPYKALVIIHKAQIENILHRMYNISYQEAYNRWYKAVSNIDPTIVKILETMIQNGHVNPETGEIEPGLPYIINRNPTISYGSIQMVFCVGINLHDYTMSLSLQVLKPLAADFDGDTEEYEMSPNLSNCWEWLYSPSSYNIVGNDKCECLKIFGIAVSAAKLLYMWRTFIDYRKAVYTELSRVGYH